MLAKLDVYLQKSENRYYLVTSKWVKEHNLTVRRKQCSEDTGAGKDFLNRTSGAQEVAPVSTRELIYRIYNKNAKVKYPTNKTAN